MRLLTGVLAVFVLVSIVNPHSLPAQVAASTEPSCLEQAAEKIRPNSKVVIFKLNGEKHIGVLDSVDLGNSHLLLKRLEFDVSPLSAFRQDEIAKIQYYKKGKLKPGYMILGFLTGAFVGFTVGLAIASDEDKNLGEAIGAVFGGTAAGAGTGLLLGTIIPAVSHSTQTIACK